MVSNSTNLSRPDLSSETMYNLCGSSRMDMAKILWMSIGIATQMAGMHQSDSFWLRSESFISMREAAGKNPDPQALIASASIEKADEALKCGDTETALKIL